MSLSAHLNELLQRFPQALCLLPHRKLVIDKAYSPVYGDKYGDLCATTELWTNHPITDIDNKIEINSKMTYPTRIIPRSQPIVLKYKEIYYDLGFVLKGTLYLYYPCLALDITHPEQLWSKVIRNGNSPARPPPNFIPGFTGIINVHSKSEVKLQQPAITRYVNGCLLYTSPSPRD